MVRDLCNLYTKEPFPQSHAGEQYTVSSRRSLSLSLYARVMNSFRHISECMSLQDVAGLDCLTKGRT